jgi:hypothetical protein
MNDAIPFISGRDGCHAVRAIKGGSRGRSPSSALARKATFLLIGFLAGFAAHAEPAPIELRADLLVVGGTESGCAEVVDTYDFGAQNFLADTQRVGCCHINGSDGFFLRGVLAELLIFEGIALARAQKNAIGFYLATKYALATGYLPSGMRLLVK